MAVFTGYSNTLEKPFDMCNCCSCTCSFFIDTTIDENEEMVFLEGKYSKELIINCRHPKPLLHPYNEQVALCTTLTPSHFFFPAC